MDFVKKNLVRSFAYMYSLVLDLYHLLTILIHFTSTASLRGIAYLRAFLRAYMSALPVCNLDGETFETNLHTHMHYILLT